MMAHKLSQKENAARAAELLWKKILCSAQSVERVWDNRERNKRGEDRNGKVLCKVWK